MWSKPWSYKEGLTIGAGLLVIGILLQMTVGAINWDLFACPVNVIVLVVYIIALIVMHLLRKRVYLFGWLSHYSAAVSALLWVVGMTVVMGLIRQVPSGHASNASTDLLGFSQMIASWPFVLLYFWMVTALGLTILRAGLPFKLSRLSFLLNHIGLFVALIAATLGNADMQRLKMTTRMGNAEWRATDDKGQLVELPLAIELKDFTIDEYPPKLMLIDNETGRTLPEKSPVHLLLEEGVSDGNLQDWQLTIEQSIPMAASVATEDTLKFTEFHSMGATYAVYLKAVNQKNQQTKEGWVSCGSFLFPYKAIRLDSLTSLVMPEREPQRFASEVKIYTQEGTITEGTIEVNRPMEVEGWKIYQLSYDETKGRWSDVSIFELVRDPWLPVVYTGIIMMMAGAICLFVNAQKRKEEDKA
ncbi:cytochrome c biogenesis protein ResB [Bacteroides congonensis]